MQQKKQQWECFVSWDCSDISDQNKSKKNSSKATFLH